MLYLLTGDIQTGKTRWLEARAAALEAAGAEVWGVLNPGVWVTRADGSLEKTGIDMAFYPAHERRPFALRADLANGVPEVHEAVVGGKAMIWRFFEERFAEANALFSEMRGLEAAEGVRRVAVFDEIGRLELAGRGNTAAMAFLDAGPTPAFDDAFAIVRSELVDDAVARLTLAWGDQIRVITPTE